MKLCNYICKHSIRDVILVPQINDPNQSKPKYLKLFSHNDLLILSQRASSLKERQVPYKFSANLAVWLDYVLMYLSWSVMEVSRFLNQKCAEDTPCVAFLGLLAAFLVSSIAIAWPEKDPELVINNLSLPCRQHFISRVSLNTQYKRWGTEHKSKT